MNLLTQVLKHEVYPALGCTEPVSCAYAAAVATSHLDQPVEKLNLRVDRATYKNGASVIIPHSGGRKGNLFAALMGASVARPDDKLQLLRNASDGTIAHAQAMMESETSSYDWFEDTTDFRIDVTATAGENTCRCIIAHGHTHIESIEVNGVVSQRVVDAASPQSTFTYREELRSLPLQDILSLAKDLDAETAAEISTGIEMNMALSEAGMGIGGTAHQLRHMREKGLIADDMFYRTKIKVASAVDARMAGVALPAMTSGGSGNQGIVAIITPCCIAQETGIDRQRMLESIAVAHLTNAYVKCYVGELAAVCGCALAAGVAVAVAVVCQQAWLDMKRITSAVNNVIGDLGGLICDGAKAGCAMKTITSVDASVRSAFMALEGFGLTSEDGVLGASAEESIRNLGIMTLEGMSLVDPTILKILREKNA